MKTETKRRILLRLFEHQNGRCAYCARQVVLSYHPHFRNLPEAATIEHLRPQSKGGKNNPGNLAMACRRCNGDRGNADWATYKSFRLGEHAEYEAARRKK